MSPAHSSCHGHHVVWALLCSVGLVVGVSCAGASVGDPVLNTAIALGFAAERVADGECLTPCTQGTRCNPVRHVCETLPCGKECEPNEVCDEIFTPPRCVAAGMVPLSIGANNTGNVQPAVPPVSAPPPSP